MFLTVGEQANYRHSSALASEGSNINFLTESNWLMKKAMRPLAILASWNQSFETDG